MDGSCRGSLNGAAKVDLAIPLGRSARDSPGGMPPVSLCSGPGWVLEPHRSDGNRGKLGAESICIRF